MLIDTEGYKKKEKDHEKGIRKIIKRKKREGGEEKKKVHWPSITGVYNCIMGYYSQECEHKIGKGETHSLHTTPAFTQQRTIQLRKIVDSRWVEPLTIFPL